MSWIVVKFIQTDEVEAVPTCWYNEKTSECFYPPFQCVALEKAIRHCMAPEKGSWSLYDVKPLSQTKYSMFQKASAKAAKACLTSDISDLEHELPSKRVPKKKVFSDEDGDSSEDSEESLTFPKAPKIQNRKTGSTKALPKNTSSQEQSNNNSEYFGPNKGVAQNSASKDQEDKTSELDYAELKSKVVLHMVKHNNNLKIQEKILNELQKDMEQIKISIQNILEILDNKTEDHMRVEFKTDMFENLPAKTSLEELETNLQNEQNFNRLRKHLLRIGGSGFKDCIKRYMKIMLSDEVAKLYSMVGYKGKKSFSKTQLFRLITERLLKKMIKK